jgi:SNF2 family DNA or RNA helicase
MGIPKTMTIITVFCRDMLDGIEGAVNILKRREKERMKHLSYIRIDGRVGAIARDEQVQKFQNQEDCRVRGFPATV